jgi:hypothetical protein
MAEKMSTGLCDQLMVGNPFRTIFDLGFIKIYSGTVPAHADDAVTGTLITTISNNSTATGITWETVSVGGVLSKKVSETWSGVNGPGGMPVTYYRLVAAGDTGALSTTQARVQGTIGTGEGDMNFGTTTLVSGTTLPINYATQAFVPS